MFWFSLVIILFAMKIVLSGSYFEKAIIRNCKS